MNYEKSFPILLYILIAAACVYYIIFIVRALNELTTKNTVTVGEQEVAPTAEENIEKRAPVTAAERSKEVQAEE